MNRNSISGKNARLLSPEEDGGAGNGSDSGNSAGSGGGERRRSWFARHTVLTIVLAVLAVGLAVGGYFVVNALTAFNDPASVLSSKATEKPAQTEAATQPPATDATAVAEPTPTPTEEPPVEFQTDRDSINILVLGLSISDVRLARGRSDAQTDCIILVHIENLKANEKPKITMLSLPRDTIVATMYDDKGNLLKLDLGAVRINTAYLNGGIEGAKKTISHYFGDIPIDRYVLFDMDFVVKLIDEMGGVDVPVKDLTADSVTVHGDIGGTYTYKNNTTMHMDGKMALTYARERHSLGMGDYIRGDHMQDVMKALLDTLKDKGNLVNHAWELYQLFSKQLTTDINDYQQIAAVAGIASRLDLSGILSKKIIRYEDMHMFEGMSVFFSDAATKKAVLKDIFGIDYTMPSSETYSSIMAPVNKIINNTKGTIDNAKTWLANHAGQYTGDPAALNKAIAAWEDAKFNKDSSKLQSTAKQVSTELAKLKATLPVPTPTAEE